MTSYLARFSLALHAMTVASVIDVIVVAVIVYQAFLLMRGTRAMQMLLGLLILALLYFAAQLGGLSTVHWIFSTTLPYFVFAVIVLFQAEIRVALAQIGRTPFARLAPGRVDRYEDIILAARYFSEHRIGALIVIERKTGLRTYIESGIALDALLGYDLLQTIFSPMGPLHDGAVIIRGERIAAAACFLPISMNPALSGKLGTRHRAGIGVTEETDAVSVIVSEVTGAMSIAAAGAIELDVTVDRLRERFGDLFRQYIPPETPKGTTEPMEIGSRQ
jgi:diadenylate cyclase